MSREEIAAFLAALKKLRDGLDDFNCQLAAIDGAGMRLGLLCQETAAACPAAAEALGQGLTGVARRVALVRRHNRKRSVELSGDCGRPCARREGT